MIALDVARALAGRAIMRAGLAVLRAGARLVGGKAEVEFEELLGPQPHPAVKLSPVAEEMRRRPEAVAAPPPAREPLKGSVAARLKAAREA